MIEIWTHENHPQIAYFFVRPLSFVTDTVRPIVFAMGVNEGVFACSKASALEIAAATEGRYGGWTRVATMTHEQLHNNIKAIVEICTQSNNT